MNLRPLHMVAYQSSWVHHCPAPHARYFQLIDSFTTFIFPVELEPYTRMLPLLLSFRWTDREERHHILGASSGAVVSPRWCWASSLDGTHTARPLHFLAACLSGPPHTGFAHLFLRFPPSISPLLRSRRVLCLLFTGFGLRSLPTS